MEEILKNMPGADVARWLTPLGTSIRLFVECLSVSSLRAFDFSDFQANCIWMGKRSFHFVVFAAVFISIALTIQTVIEMDNYRAQNFSGAVIAIGLLRELGPLTVSLAWCARVSALLAAEAQDGNWSTDRDFAHQFVFPKYIAALAMSIPLGAYGLCFGFLTGALVAPLLGVSTASDFLESAKVGIQMKDLYVYFFKLILVNPTIGVFAGCAAGWLARNNPSSAVAAEAVTATFLAGYIANAMITFIVFIP